MKSALTVVLFPLFAIGVFADGKESNVELESVTEGDSVTLKSGVTERKKDDGIEWRFSGIRIAKISSGTGEIWVKPDGSFKDRLKLVSQTGDLKIRNIRTTDSGQYKVKISRTTVSSDMDFTVKVVSADGEKTVKVNEGDSVTLNTSLTDIQRDDVIQWRFEQQKSIVAEIDGKRSIFNTYDGPDERFRDRLKLDNQTGSLIITDITATHSGLYEVEITSTSSRYTIHHTQSFSVTVRDDVKSVSVMEGESVTLHTGLTEIQRDDVILWKFGDHGELNADLNVPVNKKWSNIHLNPQTGDLNISNIRNNQYGYYKVEINTRRMILHRKYRITDVMVSVMAGDSVTLHAGFPIIQNKHAVLWFDDQDNLITHLTGIIDATGDLTIRNIRRDQSGNYKVKIISSSTMYLHRIFRINISGVFSSEKDGVKTVSVVNGHSFTLHSNVTDIQNDVRVEWMFRPQNLSIAKTDEKSKKISYNNNDVRFKNKLNLDNQTGDLSIKNSSTEHSGLYQLKIISSRYTIQKSFSVTVSVSGQSSAAVAGIVVGGVLLVAAVAGVIYRRKQQKRKTIILEEEPPQNPTLLNGNENGTDLANTS